VPVVFDHTGAPFRHGKVYIVQQNRTATSFASVSFEPVGEVFSIKAAGFQFRGSVTCSVCQRTFVVRSPSFSRVTAASQAAKLLDEHRETCIGTSSGDGVFGRIATKVVDGHSTSLIQTLAPPSLSVPAAKAKSPPMPHIVIRETPTSERVVT
jgi:hypothetical protein